MRFDEGFSVVLDGELVFRPPNEEEVMGFEEEDSGYGVVVVVEEERVEFGVGEQVFVNAAMPYDDDDDDDDDNEKSGCGVVEGMGWWWWTRRGWSLVWGSRYL